MLLIPILKVWGMARRIVLMAVVLVVQAMLSPLSSSPTVKKVHGFTPIALPSHVLHPYTMIGFMM
jgi:hypothetical protein